MLGVYAAAFLSAAVLWLGIRPERPFDAGGPQAAFRKR